LAEIDFDFCICGNSSGYKSLEEGTFLKSPWEACIYGCSFNNFLSSIKCFLSSIFAFRAFCYIKCSFRGYSEFTNGMQSDRLTSSMVACLDGTIN